ncbi:unnamed protein product [Oreochromis niloticus]|nr:unnamed protein product [Mustela putorius furo]
MKEIERTTEYREQFKHATSSCFHSSPVQHVSSSSIHKAAGSRTKCRCCSLKFQELLKRVQEEVDKYKEDDVYRRAAITKIFNHANSLDNKEKLEIFKETLQTAIEQEERLKEESKYKLRIASKQFNEKKKEFIRQLEQAMLLSYYSPPLQEIVDIGFHMLKKTRAYLDKKLDLLQE